jgi:8-oxo-dGTP diphosphatase
MPVSDQGLLPNRYNLVPRSLIFLTRDDEVLLIQGSHSKKIWADLYNGIGGHIEKGEDIVSAAQREIREETGLIPDDLWLCGVITIDAGNNQGICVFIFRGECTHGLPEPSVEGLPSWIPICEIDSLDLVEDLYIILPRILSLKKGDPPLSLLYTYDDADQLKISFGN